MTHPNCPPEDCKRKKTRRSEKATRQRKQLALHKDIKPDIKKTRKTSSQGRVRRTLTSPSKEEPQDSAVAGGGTSSGRGNNSSSSSGSGSGGSDVFNSPGGSSHRQKGGRGDDSDDGEKGWKKPGLHLPKPQDKVSSDVEMEDEKQKSSEPEKMEVDLSQQGLTAFSPSVVDNAEQCHDTSMAELSASPQKVSLWTQIKNYCFYDNSSFFVDLWWYLMKGDVVRCFPNDCLTCDRLVSICAKLFMWHFGTFFLFSELFLLLWELYP